MGGRTITAKALQGKKGNGSKDLHPKSRRVKQAARVELRTKKVADGKKERKSIEEDKIRHLLWFIQNMDSAKARLDLAGVHELCEKFLHRLDDELESERKQRREGRAMSKRQEELESAKAREEQEYGKQGLLLPDLTDEKSVVSCRYWLTGLQGNSGYFRRVRLIRVFKGSDDMPVEQEGASELSNTAKDANLEVEEADMQE